MIDRDRQDIFENALYNAGMTAQGCWENLDDYTQDAIKRLFTYAYQAGVTGEYDQFDRAGVVANPDAKREPATDEQIVKAGGECAVVDDEYLFFFETDGAPPEPPAKPEPEPVAWMESPHGAIRANPLYRITAPQSLAWSIPLYAAPPAAAKPEPATDEQAAAAYDGKRGTRQWVDFRDGWLHAERHHGIRESNT
jgi:hypothetical protein